MIVQTKLLVWDDPNNEDLGIKDDGFFVDFIFNSNKINAFYRRSDDITDYKYFHSIIYLEGTSFTVDMSFEDLKMIISKNEL